MKKRLIHAAGTVLETLETRHDWLVVAIVLAGVVSVIAMGNQPV